MVELFVAQGLSQTLPVLNSLRSAHVRDNTLWSAEIDTGLSILAHSGV
jgi:hypothetical protein